MIGVIEPSAVDKLVHDHADLQKVVLRLSWDKDKLFDEFSIPIGCVSPFFAFPASVAVPFAPPNPKETFPSAVANSTLADFRFFGPISLDVTPSASALLSGILWRIGFIGRRGKFAG